jgi:hypothetical protein
MVSSGAVKERKEWKSIEIKGGETEGKGEENTSLSSGPKSEPGKSHCCPLLSWL